MKTTREKFAKDLKIGREGEDRVIQVLAEADLYCVRNSTTQDLQGHDLLFWFHPRERRLEVKYDIYESKSGNVALEYYNPRKRMPSGINATKSDIWVFVLKDGAVWACRTDDLKKHFREKPCYRDIGCGGDDNASMKLYKREQLFGPLFIRLDSLEPAERYAAIACMLDVPT